MTRNLSKPISTVCAAGVLFWLLGGCGGPPPMQTDQFEAVRTALAAYLGSDAGPVTNAADVFDLINDGDADNDPYILSVRAPEHYDIGHVPAADNVPWREVGMVGALDGVPTDQQVVVYCYTGHTGQVATTCLRAAGYEAVNLKFGIMSWTRDQEVRVASAFDEETDAHDYPVETTDNPATEVYDLPVLDVTTSSDSAEIVRAATDAYLSAGDPPVISAADLFDVMNDGDADNDYVIVSVRSADHYAIGHIPGAINIPWRTIADLNNLEKLDPTQPIAVYCYTGHTGQAAAAALNMLGYNAINLKFGMGSWTTDQEVRVADAFDDATHSHDYPVEP